MKNLDMTRAGKLCLALILPLLSTFLSKAQTMVTYDTTFVGWNAIVTEDISLQGTDSAAGIVFFPGVGEMDKNVNDLAVNGPHYLINNGLWDGSVTLGNGVHHPFIISLQPPAAGYSASQVMPMIQAILGRYRIKRNSFYFTALSQGAWQANEFVSYEPTPGDNSYGKLVRAIVNLEGVEPSDSTGIYLSESYPRKMGHWAKACGGRELWMEGSQDWRAMQAGAQNMMDSVAGSATYFMVTYGGGAHCCWNTEYEPSVTWTLASNSNISEIVGQPQAMNVWQWLLRQGDTSMPGSQAVVATPATVSAGSGQTVTLPVDSVTLSGTATPSSGATVSSSSWSQVSGPNTATISNLVSSLVSTLTGVASTLTSSSQTISAPVTGLVAGTYVFQLTVQENNGLTSASTVTVVVNAAAVKTAPTVSGGKGQAITLPTSSVTLTGTATANGGATISTLAWVQESGPVTATIGSSSSATTSVSGLTNAGSYIFVLFATDNNGLTAYGSMTVTVNAASAAVAPTVSAGKGQAITLPTSSVTLNGVATGNGGATISTVDWVQETGPVTATFASSGSTTTTVTGMTTAGSYVFVLFAKDNNGLSAYGSMTVTVNATGTASTTSAALSGQATFVTDSTQAVDSTLENPAGSLLIFPNPAPDLLNIRLSNAVTGKVMVMIFNTKGNLISASAFEKEGINLEGSVDVSRLNQGMYILQVVTGTNCKTTRAFIKL